MFLFYIRYVVTHHLRIAGFSPHSESYQYSTYIHNSSMLFLEVSESATEAVIDHLCQRIGLVYRKYAWYPLHSNADWEIINDSRQLYYIHYSGTALSAANDPGYMSRNK